MRPLEHRLRIDIRRQTLCLCNWQGDSLSQYQISSAAKGVGEVINSQCTPRGRHIIRAKIGHRAPLDSIFVGRRLSGEIFKPAMRSAMPQRDWILTRIMWLSGCETGFNRLGEVDSMRRFIYIHGTPDDVEIGKPNSHGCIRMRNHDVVALFDRIAIATPVDIHE